MEKNSGAKIGPHGNPSEGQIRGSSDETPQKQYNNGNGANYGFPESHG